jgi:sporulation protein YlmC with PRC-barrel domain
MRAGDLIGRPVEGPDGERLGTVLDIRVVQDGPMLGAYAALRVDGLVVGTRDFASRLGYDRTGVEGPKIVSVLVHALMRGNCYLPWSQVDEIGDVIRSSAAELAEVPRIR